MNEEVIDLLSEPREGFPACPILFWRAGVSIAAVLTEIGHFMVCISQQYKLIYSLEPNKCQYGAML
jgi:hypothetical protein